MPDVAVQASSPSTVKLASADSACFQDSVATGIGSACVCICAGVCSLWPSPVRVFAAESVYVEALMHAEPQC